MSRAQQLVVVAPKVMKSLGLRRQASLYHGTRKLTSDMDKGVRSMTHPPFNL